MSNMSNMTNMTKWHQAGISASSDRIEIEINNDNHGRNDPDTWILISSTNGKETELLAERIMVMLNDDKR